MKMSNDDIKKITEIKLFFLDPPVSFKLDSYAIDHTKNAIIILQKYTAANDVQQHFNIMLQSLENKTIEQQQLRNMLKEAGIKISHLTNK